MTRSPTSAGPGFTAFFCEATGRGCAAHGLDDSDVVEARRRTVRICPHGVLVSVGCLTGSCADGAGPGRLVVVQPCSDATREPVGAAVVVGPLHERGDVDELCEWLRRGVGRPWSAHLRAGPPTDPL